MARETMINGSSGEQMRIYAPSDGSLAYRQDYAYRTTRLAAQPKYKPEAQPEARPKPEQRRKSEKQRISLLQMARENRFMLKLFAVCCIVAVAAVAVFAVIRFVGIASIQQDINNLNTRIAETRRSIDDLRFNCQPIINATEFSRSVGLVPAQP